MRSERKSTAEPEFLGGAPAGASLRLWIAGASPGVRGRSSTRPTSEPAALDRRGFAPLFLIGNAVPDHLAGTLVAVPPPSKG